MNEEHKAFAKEISEMLTNMYNRGFADCEAAAKLAIEAGIKKAMLLEREACAMIVNGRWLKGLSYQGCADEIRARGEQ
jgi:hypothetical protein